MVLIITVHVSSPKSRCVPGFHFIQPKKLMGAIRKYEKHAWESEQVFSVCQVLSQRLQTPATKLISNGRKKNTYNGGEKHAWESNRCSRSARSFRRASRRCSSSPARAIAASPSASCCAATRRSRSICCSVLACSACEHTKHASHANHPLCLALLCL